jgi:hypothetical protein
MSICLHESTGYSCQILTTPKFSLQIFKDTQITNSIQILREGVEILHADGQTDMKLRVAFRNSAKAPKNDTFSMCCT